MNKKIIKKIVSVTCGMVAVGSIPAIVSSCGEKNTNAPTSLVFSEPIKEISVKEYTDLSTDPLTDIIYTDKGVKVEKGLLFSISEGTLPNGVKLDSSTGQFTGGKTTGRCVNELIIQVSATIDGKSLIGFSNEFKLVFTC